MSVPDHEIEKGADGSCTVRVGGGVAGFISPDAEHPGLWVVEDPDGRFMGRHLDPEEAAAFLAAWFAARDEE